jgi:hypothetical protein
MVRLNELVPNTFLAQLVRTETKKARHCIVAPDDAAARVYNNKIGLPMAVETVDYRPTKFVTQLAPPRLPLSQTSIIPHDGLVNTISPQGRLNVARQGNLKVARSLSSLKDT